MVAGTRMGVDTIIGYHRAYGGDVDRILEEFPSLTREQVEAALSWYEAHDYHRAEIDALLKEHQSFYELGLARQRTKRKRPVR